MLCSLWKIHFIFFTVLHCFTFLLSGQVFGLSHVNYHHSIYEFKSILIGLIAVTTSTLNYSARNKKKYREIGRYTIVVSTTEFYVRSDFNTEKPCGH